jgi:mono/diheme cytochrome c family protein
MQRREAPEWSKLKQMSLRLAVLGLAAVITIGGALRRETASAQAPQTIWSGIYTKEQADRGEMLYADTCATCHGSALQGGEMAPPLTGPEFDANWDTVSLGELVERVRTTMPSNNPGSLTRQQVTDILAHLLARAKAPAGTTDLPTQVDALNTIIYTAKPGAK